MRQGLKLNIVRDGGAAEKAGLLVGDVLVRYGSHDLFCADDLTRAISGSSGKVKIIFVRTGKLRALDIEVGPLGVSFGEVGVEVPEEEAIGLDVPVDALDFERIASELLAAMVVTTAPSVDGYVAKQQLGVISAECVFGLNVFKDFFAGLTDFFGGRSGTTQAALREAREVCLRELKREALGRGANAIIAVDLDYSEFSGQGKSMLFLVATGTAVVLEAKE